MALARSELTAFFLPYGKYPLSGFSTCVLCAKQAALPVSDSDPPIRSLLASGLFVEVLLIANQTVGAQYLEAMFVSMSADCSSINVTCGWCRNPPAFIRLLSGSTTALSAVKGERDATFHV
ncbi:hypothetical protein Tco_1028224 [Tanacetum coccineum]|uniref:Uncharacterized protein n=1 Tax=Tanacetum coccineum TaxID=301880 RepID=A0ABQ5G029_9ASTR